MKPASLTLQARKAGNRRLHRMGWRVAFWLGVFSVLIGFLLVNARADYVVNRYTGTLTNPKAQTQRKRVIMYDAVPNPATTQYQWIPTDTTSSTNATSTHYVQYQVYVDGVLVHTSAQIANPNGLGSAWTGYTWTGPTQTKSTAFASRSVSKRIWSTALGNQWGAYNSLAAGQIGSVTTNQVSQGYTRGVLLHQYEFEMSPFSSMALKLEHTGPFFVVIEDYKEYLTPDGGTAYGWEPVQELTSTQVTQVSPTTTAPPPESKVDAPGVAYTSGATPAATPRPNAVADTTDKLDKNQEARHTDEKSILMQIKAGIDASVNAISGLAGGRPSASETPEEAEQITSENEHEQSTIEKLEGLKNSASNLASSVSNLYGELNIARPASQPQFYFELPIPWAAGQKIVLTSNPTMDAWMAIARQIMLVSIAALGVVGTIVIIRGASADQH